MGEETIMLSVTRALQQTRATASKLRRMIVTTGEDTFDLLTDGEANHVSVLFNLKGAQGFRVEIAEGTTCQSHSHSHSTEFFIIIEGVLDIFGRIYKQGDVAQVKSGVEHAPKSIKGTGDCVVLCILTPPEMEYSI